MTVHDSIVRWSRSRPLWQQDALRRLVDGPVNSRDVEELAALARQEYHVTPKVVLKAIPLADEDLAESDGRRDAVVLFRVGNFAHVNALKSDQEMTFAANGLTIVFGPTLEDVLGFFGHIGVFGTIKMLGVLFLPPIVLTYLENRKARRERGF